MPFFIGEEPTQSNWTETNENALSFILNKPAVIKGEQGNNGEKGQKGEIGPRGIEGEKGEQGNDGEKGQKGQVGVGQKGEVGEKGIDGSKGQKGEEGLSITGEKGEKGMPSNIAGEKGEKGELGNQGDKGIQGQKGIQGETGSKGQKGEIGNIGITGAKGQKGEQGIIGNTGSKGEKGEIGLTGDKGQKGEVHSSKFINNGSLNSSDEIEVVYDDGTNMTNKIDISSLRELPTMLNTYYGKRLTVVQPSTGSGVEAMWVNQDTYSFTESRTTAQLEVQKVEQNTTSPYFNTTTTNTYNFLPVLVNDKVLTVSNGALTWSDFPADDNTRVSGFSIDASHNLSLSQNDATAPYSVSLAPYLDNTDNYITSYALSNGLLTGTMTGGQANPTGQILPTNTAGFLNNNGTGTLSYIDRELLPSQTNNDDKFLKTDGTNASWTNKIGSSISHTMFYWNGGTPNHYLLNQATSAGSELGNIAFGNTNGTFYSSISGKVRDSTSGQLRGFIQINTQHGDSSANLDEEILRIGESSNSTSDAGEFFGNLKVAGVKFTNNSVQTLPVITPTSSDVGKFLTATSIGAFDWHNKIGSSTAYNWFYWSGGIINSYLLSQPSSAGDQCGAITFGHTNGTMFGSIYGKVRDTTAGQLRGYIQIDTQNNNGTDVLTEETLRIGESTHSTSDAGEFFGNLRVNGIKYSGNNNIQTEAVEAPTAADGTASRVLTATGANTWAWSDPSAIVVNTLQSGATQNGTEVYNAWYHDTVRGIDALAKLDKSEVKNTLQSGATQNGTEVYNAWYHDTVRGIDALAKLDKSHVQSVYQATPNADDVYNCAHHDLAFKNTYGILYGNTQSSCYTTGYINQFYRESNNQKDITLVSSNTSQNDTLGSVQAWDGNNYLSSAIAFLLSNETTVSGRINFYSYTNNNHATAGPSVYIQDDIINVKDLEAIRSITQNSVLNTSNITNTCPANPKFISKSSTSTSTAVIGNFQTQALVNITGNVQYPPALSSNTSTVSGITYTLTASTNAFTGSSYNIYKAFDRINNTGWHSHGNYNSSNNPTTMGQYQGSNSLGGVSGEWIQIQMSSAQPFGSVKIIGRQGYDPQAADSWELLASNNGSSWTSILQSTVHLTYNSGNGHTISINNTTSFTHYAIIAKTVAGPSSAYLTIHEIEFYTAVTTAYGEFTDLKTTKYGTDWGLLDINVRQNASLIPLVRIGKTQASDQQDIMWNGKVQCTDTFTVSNLKIQGTGSNITFDNGLSQQFAVVNPTSSQNGYVLTASATGFDWQLGGASTLLSLSDVNETAYTSQNHRVLTVNSTGNGMEFGGVYGIDDSAKKINIGDGNISDMGNQSIAIGHEAGVLHANRSKQNSVFIGYQAAKNTAAPQSGSDSQQTDNSVIIGNRAAFDSNFLENSVIIGSEAALSASHRPHANSVVIGAFAANNQGTDNQASGDSYSSVYIGCNAGRNVHLGHQNVVIGRDCLFQYSKGGTSEVSSDNLMMGNMAGRNMYGSFNAVVGTSCLRYDASGHGKAEKNACIGYNCLSNFTEEVKENVAIGHNSMFGSGACQNNISIGYESGRYSSGNSNISIGRATSYQQSGSNNIYIGNFIRTSATSNSNELIIGNNNLPNPIILGKMESNVSNSEITFNAKTVNLSRPDMPTSYDSSYPNRIWIDGAGTSTASNISGVLRVGQVNTQYNSSTGQNNNVLQCANSNSSIFAFTHTSANRTQNNKHNLTISVNSNLEFVYLFDVKPTHAFYIITAQHEMLPSSSIVETDTNTYITNKTVNGFTLTFKVGDNSTVVDSPSILCDHSISIMGVSANQIDTTSNTIPQLGQTNIFPTGFNLA